MPHASTAAVLPCLRPMAPGERGELGVQNTQGSNTRAYTTFPKLRDMLSTSINDHAPHCVLFS